MLIREAIDSDKDTVLDFCKNTFEWGDYIDRIWDSWINDPSGLLLVTEINYKNKSKGHPIALARISACPNNLSWIEGLRVNPEYRKQGIATSLLEYMLNFGIEKGYTDISAIVSTQNILSQKILEKQGFFKLQRFNYYNIDLEKFRNTNTVTIEHSQQEQFDIKLADYTNISNIIEYLKVSTIFNQSYKRYFDSWKFYKFENNYSDLKSLVGNKKMFLITDQSKNINGLLILNNINSNNNNNNYKKRIIQICYMDCIDIKSYSKIIKYLINFFLGKKNYSSIEFYLPDIASLLQNIKFRSLDYLEQFFLYNKILK